MKKLEIRDLSIKKKQVLHQESLGAQSAKAETGFSVLIQVGQDTLLYRGEIEGRHT
jgi:hypothetical protein